MKISLGISPCPNDTFIFDALINKKINNNNFEFELIIKDVEELNKMALQEQLDVTKISLFGFLKVQHTYSLLDSGAAIGFANGPILVSKHKVYPDEIADLSIAIPGANTTANLLLTLLFPEAKNKKEYIFSDIEEVVLSEEKDAGLLIHESRFSYEKKGLKKIIDLGELWEKQTHLPIPLGAIAISKKIPENIQKEINNLIQQSLKFAWKHPVGTLNFIKKLSQEKNEDIIWQHINLYVNEYTESMGDTGRKAIQALAEKTKEQGLIPSVSSKLFIS